MIIITIIIAVFSYLLAPDPSPFGNRIILEIGGEKPGYQKDFLLVKKVEPKQAGFFSRTFEGRPDRSEVEAALERIAHRMLVQRDWTDDRAELVSSG